MKRSFVVSVFIVLFFSGFFLLPNLVFADITISRPITSDTTWSPSGGVYIVDVGFFVSAGATLTIEPGTVVKVKNLGYWTPDIFGKIVAIGTKDAPVYFTSISNDGIGGDTDSYPGVGPDNHWQGLYFRSGSEGDLDYVDISYAGAGGYGTGDYVGIENDGGTLNIKNSNIHDNSVIVSDGAGGSAHTGTGIYNKSGTLSVTDSFIENNTAGIVSESGNVIVSNNIIKNNYNRGASFGGEDTLILTNNTFLNNGRTVGVSASLKFTHSGNTSEDLSYKGFEVGGNISEDTTFASGDLPYIINNLTIKADKTLTLEPGTILKMNDYYSTGALDVSGNLIAKGTPEKKIYITSLRDDSVGGDTNGDGDATVPAPKNWGSIFLQNGSKVDFDNVTVRYGGYNYNGEYLNIAAAVYNRGADFLVSNSVFENNAVVDIFQDAGIANITKSELKNGHYGVWFRAGYIKISQSSLTSHTGLAIYNDSGPAIDAKNNWWGDATGPRDISTTTPTGIGGGVSGSILYQPFLTESPLLPKRIDPVIIIPGIMGSATKNGQLLIDPILHTYDDLIATLIANGYVEGKDLFTFPYEWRDSNVLTANLLKQKISEVKAVCNCDKVDLVAHSMGGLVAREYIQSDQYQKDVDQIIFLGTPHKGSPKAYLQWEAGEFSIGPTEFLSKTFFEVQALKNGYLGIFNYIHNRPISSVQELLPTFDYLKDKDTVNLRTYPNNYPRNMFLEALNSNTGIQELLNSGVNIINIVGNAGSGSTIEKIRVVDSSNSFWANGEPDGFEGSIGDYGLEKGNGDGTVTIYGATLDNSVLNEEWNGVKHNSLPKETSARVFNILTNKIADNIIFLTKIEKIFSIQLQSPVDMLIIAPDGKRMGKNFVTGEEYNEISGAFYSGFNNGDEEYITIPNPLDGEYKIELQGTGDGGEFGVVTNYISDESSVSKEYTDTVKPREIKETSVITDDVENVLSLEIKTKEIALAPIVKYGGGSSGSRHQIVGEVLGANTTAEEQRALQLKLIEYLKQLISLYMLLLNK